MNTPERDRVSQRRMDEKVDAPSSAMATTGAGHLRALFQREETTAYLMLLPIAILVLGLMAYPFVLAVSLQSGDRLLRLQPDEQFVAVHRPAEFYRASPQQHFQTDAPQCGYLLYRVSRPENYNRDSNGAGAPSDYVVPQLPSRNSPSALGHPYCSELPSLAVDVQRYVWGHQLPTPCMRD